MLPRFYTPALTPEIDRLDLQDDEAHHLSKVLRLKQGDPVLVFDGAGLQRQAQVGELHRARVTLQLGAVAPAAPELAVRVVLAQALLKGDSMDQVVRDATTVGVHEIVPLVTSHTDVRLAADRVSGRVDRWQRIAVSATKQCGRAVVPSVRQPAAFADVIGRRGEAVCLMLVEPLSGVRLTPLDALRPAAPGAQVIVLVGSEGGWSPEELDLAARGGVDLVSLGGRTLRAETVAIAGLPVVLYAMRTWP